MVRAGRLGVGEEGSGGTGTFHASKSEVVVDDDEDEEDDDDEDDEDDGEDDDEDDEGDDDDDETQRDETESVTVVGDDEEGLEKEVEVLDTIQEEKVRPRAALYQLRKGDGIEQASRLCSIFRKQVHGLR